VRTLFYNLRLFDGLTPKLVGNRVVVVRDGRIAVPGGDPLTDLGALADVIIVVKDGKIEKSAP